jgi:hypothetical protein
VCVRKDGEINGAKRDETRRNETSTTNSYSRKCTPKENVFVDVVVVGERGALEDGS